MKKIFIALACMIMATGSAMAQKQFTFGPKVGVDYTHFWGEDHKIYQGVFNYQVGAFFEYRFTNKFSIAPEVVFASQGAKLDHDLLGIPFYSLNVNYINVPVMLKYYVCPSLSIDLGPQIGFNVYSKRVLDGSKETTDLKDNTNSIDLGIGLGLTYNITNDVFVQGRYTLGLTEVYKSSVEEKHMKNGNAQIAIGYRF